MAKRNFIDWSKVDKLGRVSDRELARLTGHTYEACKSARRRRNLKAVAAPGYDPMRPIVWKATTNLDSLTWEALQALPGTNSANIRAILQEALGTT